MGHLTAYLALSHPQIFSDKDPDAWHIVPFALLSLISILINHICSKCKNLNRKTLDFSLIITNNFFMIGVHYFISLQCAFHPKISPLLLGCFASSQRNLCFLICERHHFCRHKKALFALPNFKLLFFVLLIIIALGTICFNLNFVCIRFIR